MKIEYLGMKHRDISRDLCYPAYPRIRARYPVAEKDTLLAEP